MDADLEFSCCFCGKGIVPTRVDPLNINIVGNYDEYLKKHGSLEDQPSQDYYCHFSCLKNKMEPYYGGYLMESNFIIND